MAGARITRLYMTMLDQGISVIRTNRLFIGKTSSYLGLTGTVNFCTSNAIFRPGFCVRTSAMVGRSALPVLG